MPFLLTRESITSIRADAVVNAANSNLVAGGGVCGAIFDAAGYDELTRACNAIGHCDTGFSVITPGFRLSKYIIHTVGPIYYDGNQGEESLLRSCYRSSLMLAEKEGVSSVAFPLVSSGIYGYPPNEAFRVARESILEFLSDHEITVYLCLYGRMADVFFKDIEDLPTHRFPEMCKVSSALSEASSPVESYSGKKRDVKKAFPLSSLSRMSGKMSECVSEEISECDDYLNLGYPESGDPFTARVKESFSTMLLRLIDQQGITDVEFYKRANMDRRLFSKVRKENYVPSKLTAISCCIALRLNLDQSTDLLAKAGYAFSDSSLTDIIITHYIEHENWDVFEINETLFHYHQRLLGA